MLGVATSMAFHHSTKQKRNNSFPVSKGDYSSFLYHHNIDKASFIKTIQKFVDYLNIAFMTEN